MTVFIALISGVVFGTGLALSGMLDPSKVTGFLDLFGLWDPSLAFVMGGGVAVNAFGLWLFRKHDKPVFGDAFHLPTTRQIDSRLLLGSVLFGIGWGVSGLCPGPAVASALLNPADGLAFVVMVMAGLALGRSINKRLTI